MTFRPGDIGLSRNYKNKISFLMSFFADSQYSHSFVMTDPVLGIESLQQASFEVCIVPLDRYDSSDFDRYQIWQIKDPYFDQEKAKQALAECHQEFSGNTYGYIQLLWFIWRWFIKKVFKKDISHQENWWTEGVICSELVYWYLHKLGEPFQSILASFNADTITPEDIHQVMLAHPELFEKRFSNIETYKK
jgi:hypothetical protein